MFGPSYRVNIITSSSTEIPSFYYNAINQFNSNPPSGILTNPGTDVIGMLLLFKQFRIEILKLILVDLISRLGEDPQVLAGKPY